MTTKLSVFKQGEPIDLCGIQHLLKAPKEQVNAFGKYRYRSCEDILEAVKPLVHAAGGVLIISDEIVQVADRVYVRATATLTIGERTWSSTALAREPAEKKGMDSSQITGMASSYARKYALNGLFAIDDTRDADATNGNGQQEHQADDNGELEWSKTQHLILECSSLSELQAIWGRLTAGQKKAFEADKNAAKKRLEEQQ